MTNGNLPDSGLDCPRCDGTLETWARAQLQVEFCDSCSALFLDRGELFQLFRSEGYNCPPEAELRMTFSPQGGETLDCPKCRKSSLMPGTIEGVDMWHCTPCNGFLVDRTLLLGGAEAHDAPLHLQGFRRLGSTADEKGGGYLDKILSRLTGRA